MKLKWQKAPVKTQWGDEMVVASVAIDKDHTVCLYCERDQTSKVDSMFAQPAQQEPFGYFKAEPFGWTDCAETDEGAVALYTTPQPAQTATYTCGVCGVPMQMEQPAPVQQEPWGACVYGRVFVGRLPAHARKFSEDEGVPIQWLYTSPPAQRKPLTYVELRRIANQCGLGANEVSARTQATVDNYARAIEAAHNIKENT